MSDAASDALSVRTLELERRLQRAEERLKVLEDLDDRVDGHDRDIESIRSEIRGMRREITQMRSDMSRLVDVTTSDSLVLAKVAGMLEKLVCQCAAGCGIIPPPAPTAPR